MKRQNTYSLTEEILNSTTHGLGLIMGLTILVAFKPFYQTCGLPVVLWVVGEGIAYITGAVLYSLKKVPYIHSVFHIFVIFGDICHMIATWMVIKMFILSWGI